MRSKRLTRISASSPRHGQRRFIDAPDAPSPRHEALPAFNGPYAGVAGGIVAQHIDNPYGTLERFRALSAVSASVSAGLWGFAGVNYPIHDAVAGGEIDAGGFSPYGALAASASLRAGLGVVVRDGVLIYATGGGALGQFAASPRGPGALDASWIAGGGVETMISAGLPWRVSWRIEYLNIGPAGGRAANVVGTGFAIPF